jgi:dTDP-4-dehydrorhamnose reductase
LGPRNLSIAATETNAKMIQISTDYVFPGTGNKPLTEFDRPDPIGVYGSTKYAGEKMVQDFARNYFIIRTAWLYGDGNNFVKTMLKLSETNDTNKCIRTGKSNSVSSSDGELWTVPRNL